MKKQRTIDILAVLLLVAALLLSAWSTWYGTQILDSDASSELVLADLLHREGGIMSENWGYSTEIRVINTQLIYKPLFSIFSSWHMVRFAAAMLMQVFLLLSWALLGRQLKYHLQGLCLGGALLLLPVSVAWGRIVLYHCYYMPHITQAFLLVALLLACEKATGKKAVLLCGLLLAGSVCTGLTGIRHLMSTIAPLVLCFPLRYLHKGSVSKQELKKLPREAVPLLLAGIGCLAGYLVYSRILLTRYSVLGSVNTRVISPVSAEHLWMMVIAWLKAFGYTEGVTLFSVHGIMSLAAVFAGIGVIVPAVSACRRENGEKKFIAGFFLAGLVMTAVTFAFMDEPGTFASYSRFWLLPYAWAIPMLMTPENQMQDREVIPFTKLISGAVALVMLVSGLATVSFFRHPEKAQIPYDGLVYDVPTQALELYGPVEWIRQQGGTLVICLGEDGDYWGGNSITELTDGSLKAVLFRPSWGFVRDLNDKRILNSLEKLKQERIFGLLRNKSSEFFLGSPLSKGAEVVYQDDFFTVVDYGPEALMEAFGSYCEK